MTDQAAPTGPVDPAAAAAARSSIAGGAGMFGKPPEPVRRTPGPEEMRQVDKTAGERGQTTADRSLQYRQSYDDAVKATPQAKPAFVTDVTNAEKPPSDGQQQPTSTDLEAQVAKFREWEAKERVRSEALKTPADYKAELPSDFKLPEGIEFRLKPDDPMLEAARSWAHRRGLDQETFSEAVALYAGQQARDAVAFKAARDAELVKLGSAAPARIDAVLQGLVGMVGRESANALASMMITADIVGAFEKILTRHINGGVISSPTGGAREAVPRGPTDEEWSKMSWHEKREFQRGTALAAAPQRRR